MISAVIKYEDDSVTIHSSATKAVGKVFEEGFYETWTTNSGELKIQAKSIDEYHEPYSTPENKIIVKATHAFFDDGILEKVNSLGFTHKLGVLLYGKQGTGKTSMINFIGKRMVEEKSAIVFFCSNGNRLSTAIGLAKQIREVQENPIIFIADEFERYCYDYESELKNLLDGNDSINNSLFLASTNYIDKVPVTLKERPSRFKVCINIGGITDKELIKVMIKNISDKLKPNLFTAKQIEAEVSKVKDVTLDEVKHICLNKLTETYLPTGKKTLGFVNERNSDDDDSNVLGKLITTLNPFKARIGKKEKYGSAIADSEESDRIADKFIPIPTELMIPEGFYDGGLSDIEESNDDE